MKALLKTILIGLILTISATITFGQGINVDATGVSINKDESTSHASAILDIKSTNQGILVPRMDSATIAGITSPAKGLLAYDTINTVFWFNDGTNWKKLNQWSESGNSYTLPASDGTVNQVLSTNGSGSLSWANQSTGDITGVTAGDGLTGGGTSGSVTLNIAATNGLTDIADAVKLGGSLTENTTITQGNYRMTYNLSGTGDFDIQDNGSSKFFVKDDGNVGIGTNSPDCLLEVKRTSGSGYMSSFVNTSDNVSDYSHIKLSSGTTYNAMGTIGIVHTNSTYTYLQGFAYFLGLGNGLALRAIDAGGVIKCFTGGNGEAYERMRIDATGKVGIGTTTPSAELEINGWIGRTAHNNGALVGSYNNVGANSSNTNPIYTVGSSYKPTTTTLGNMYGIGYTHTNANFISTSDNSWGLYIAADGDARIWLAATEDKNSYFNAGKVGFGTTAPNSTVDIDGSLSAAIVTKTSNYTATTSDYTIVTNPSASNITISLPTASGVTGRIYNIINSSTSRTYSVTVDAYSSQTINLGLTTTVDILNSVTIQSDGSNWWIIQ